MARFKKKLSRVKISRSGPRKVVVPNLSGLSRSAAQNSLTSLGLVYSESSTTTSVSGEDNTISSQGVAASSTVNIGSTISFVYRSYVAPYSNPPPYDNTYYNPYSNPPPYDNTYSNPPPYSNTYSNPPASDCEDDDAGFCSGCAFYQYRTSPSGQFSCPPRLLCANGCWYNCGTAYSGC